MTPFNFPIAIQAVIRAACANARPRHYGVTFIHTETGEPTTSLGRLSGGLETFGVYDDLIVGPDGSDWGIWSDRGEPLGTFETPQALRAGIEKAIADLYPSKRSMRLAA